MQDLVAFMSSLHCSFDAAHLACLLLHFVASELACLLAPNTCCFNGTVILLAWFLHSWSLRCLHVCFPLDDAGCFDARPLGDLAALPLGPCFCFDAACFSNAASRMLARFHCWWLGYLVALMLASISSLPPFRPCPTNWSLGCSCCSPLLLARPIGCLVPGRFAQCSLACFPFANADSFDTHALAIFHAWPTLLLASLPLHLILSRSSMIGFDCLDAAPSLMLLALLLARSLTRSFNPSPFGYLSASFSGCSLRCFCLPCCRSL